MAKEFVVGHAASTRCWVNRKILDPLIKGFNLNQAAIFLPGRLSRESFAPPLQRPAAPISVAVQRLVVASSSAERMARELIRRVTQITLRRMLSNNEQKNSARKLCSAQNHDVKVGTPVAPRIHVLPCFLVVSHIDSSHSPGVEEGWIPE